MMSQESHAWSATSPVDTPIIANNVCIVSPAYSITSRIPQTVACRFTPTCVGTTFPSDSRAAIRNLGYPRSSKRPTVRSTSAAQLQAARMKAPVTKAPNPAITR